MILFCYLLDPNLSETEEDDLEHSLPSLPSFVNEKIQFINIAVAKHTILNISKSYDNYLLKFYKKGEWNKDNIKMGQFQKVF